MKMSRLDVFNTRWQPNAAGCWIWQRGKACGYGQFWDGLKVEYAH